VSVILHHCTRCGGRVAPYRSGHSRPATRTYWCPACQQQLPAPNLETTGEACPGCQGLVPSGDRFCAHCGGALAERPDPAGPEAAGPASTVLTPPVVTTLKLVLDLLPRLTAEDLEVLAGECQERLRKLRGEPP
jgi:hypothetical protein